MFEIKINCNNCGYKNTIYLCTAENNPVCDNCKKLLLEVHPIKGLIYVLSNPSMQDVLKIGLSTRNVETRVKELETTGVPAPFQIEAYFPSNAPEQHEAQIHNALKEFRLSNREFFKVDIGIAVNVISSLLNKSPIYSRTSQQTSCFGKFYDYRDLNDNCKNCIARDGCLKFTTKKPKKK